MPRKKKTKKAESVGFIDVMGIDLPLEDLSRGQLPATCSKIQLPSEIWWIRLFSRCGSLLTQRFEVSAWKAGRIAGKFRRSIELAAFR